MKPEEIDKLFKDRLTGLSTTPSADAWMRLQQKMEPPKKERTLWLYYVAASISILLITGLLYFRNNTTNPGTTVAQVEVKMPQKKIKNLPAPEATNESIAASTIKTTEQNGVKDLNKEQEVQVAAKSTIKNTAELKAGNMLARVAAAKPVIKEAKTIQQPERKEVADKPEQALALENKTVLPTDKNANSLTSSNTSINVVQVLIKQDNTDEETLANQEETDLRENLARKGALPKNIYKQARNLKNGEPVELATLGIDTEKINSESKNIKQKLTKVISL